MHQWTSLLTASHIRKITSRASPVILRGIEFMGAHSGRCSALILMLVQAGPKEIPVTPDTNESLPDLNVRIASFSRGCMAANMFKHVSPAWSNALSPVIMTFREGLPVHHLFANANHDI